MIQTVFWWTEFQMGVIWNLALVVEMITHSHLSLSLSTCCHGPWYINNNNNNNTLRVKSQKFVYYLVIYSFLANRITFKSKYSSKYCIKSDKLFQYTKSKKEGSKMISCLCYSSDTHSLIISVFPSFPFHSCFSYWTSPSPCLYLFWFFSLSEFGRDNYCGVDSSSGPVLWGQGGRWVGGLV